jgi:hypothetical protein
MSFVNLRELTLCHHNQTNDVKEYQEYLGIASFPDLQVLTIEHLACFKELSMLIDKTNGNILKVDVFLSGENVQNTGMFINQMLSEN